MTEWISNWAEAIIIAVIIATIIEMLLPEGNSKKYIKVVIGIYILFTIISPVITKFTGKSVAVSDVINLDDYIKQIEEKEINPNSLQESNSSSIRDVYIGNLKLDIKSKLKLKGYDVNEIILDVSNDDNYTLNKIQLSLAKAEDENKEEENKTNVVEIVNEINISISNTQTTEKNKTVKSNLSNSEIKKIKEYLSSVYEINENNISIN